MKPVYLSFLIYPMGVKTKTMQLPGTPAGQFLNPLCFLTELSEVVELRDK